MHMCLYVVVVGGVGSLPLGELIQKICSASREGERGLIGTECVPHTCIDTHIHILLVSVYRAASALPTAAGMNTPGPKHQSSNNKLYQLLWLVVTNVLCSLTRVTSAASGLTNCHHNVMQVYDCEWSCPYTCWYGYACHVNIPSRSIYKMINKTQIQRMIKMSRKYGLYIFPSSASGLIKMYFYLWVGSGRGGLTLYSVHHLLPERKASGCQTEKPAGSLFECQSSRRGNGIRTRWLKFLPPCWLHLPNKLWFLS